MGEKNESCIVIYNLMESQSTEIIVSILEFITEPRDIYACMQVCGMWYVSMDYLNEIFVRDFEAQNYMRIASILLWSPKDCAELLKLCANKNAVKHSKLRKDEKCLYAIRILFTREDPVGILTRCIETIKGRLVHELYGAWDFIQGDINIANDGMIHTIVNGRIFKVWLGDNQHADVQPNNDGYYVSVSILADTSAGKYLFEMAVGSAVSFTTFIHKTNAVIKKFREIVTVKFDPVSKDWYRNGNIHRNNDLPAITYLNYDKKYYRVN